MDLYYQSGSVEFASGEAHTLLSQGRGSDVRNSGQVSTPDDVADAMSAWVMAGKPRCVMDPAAGLGHLLHACRRKLPDCKVVGIESDGDVFATALTTAPAGTKLVLSDYLRTDTAQIDAIIANPPYVKSQRMGMSESEWRYFDELFGAKLGRQTNLYALFILKIWQDLSKGGRAAIIVPAEFLNANFGVVIKERLQAMKPRGLAVFAPDVNLFEGTLTTSAVVFLEKRTSPSQRFRGACVRNVEQLARFVGSLETATASAGREIDLGSLAPEEKWLNKLFKLDGNDSKASLLEAKIGDFFRCSRGIATGANHFFCLRPSELEDAGLSLGDVERCVTKAADLSAWLVDDHDFRSLESGDKRCYLFHPKKLSDQVVKYLDQGIAEGIDQRHLPSKRPTWYLPEKTKQPQIFVPVFTRTQPRFILNTANLKNLTCFHGLYAKPGLEKLVPIAWLYLNSSRGLRAFGEVNRFYGNGLNKLEPKDVEHLPCPDLRLSERKRILVQEAIFSLPAKLSVAWFDKCLADVLPEQNPC